ncbi:MerR family transcriptional regulator [Streptomyces echinoruber]|uniref:MerR family transcriptional regulator n=1 Tax=Streptomyces echinoruber TaxID=68898 RepID=UPI0027E4B4FF|nr:MerR family transcriptional regulator [Streptomyces echinoruber]
MRYYEEHGLLHPARPPNGYRSCPPDAVEVVENIRLLLATGLTTEDLLPLGTCLRDEAIGGHRCDDLAAEVEVFEQRLAVIQRRIDELTAVRERLLARLNDPRGRGAAATRRGNCSERRPCGNRPPGGRRARSAGRRGSGGASPGSGTDACPATRTRGWGRARVRWTGRRVRRSAGRSPVPAAPRP